MPSMRERETPRQLEPIKRATRVPSALDQDVWIYRIGTTALGLVVLGSLIAASILSYLGKSLPEVVVALGSAAVGGLAGLLSRRR